MRMHTIAVAAGVGLLALGTAFAQVAGGSNAFGKTLAEWMELDNTWRLGGDQDNPEGKMVFLPDFSFVSWDDTEIVYDEDRDVLGFYGALDATLRPGQKFSMPLTYYNFWAYEDGSEEDPADFDIEGILAQYHQQIWLDGEVIIDSDDADFDDYWYTVYFDEMIEFDETNSYGGIGAIAAAGHGFVHEPLSKGEHTLIWYLFLEDGGNGFGIENEFTLNITVEK